MKTILVATTILLSSAVYAEGTVGNFPLVVSCRSQNGLKVLKQVHGVDVRSGQLVAYTYESPQTNNFNKKTVVTINPQDLAQCAISPNYVGGALY